MNEEIVSDITEIFPSGLQVRTIKTREQSIAPDWFKKKHGDDTLYYYESESKQGILASNSEEAQDEFGMNHGCELWELNSNELRLLTEGKILAREINGGEYTCFLQFKVTE